ncbi:PREDICTED: ATP synthase subunit b, mitochondrial [Papilio xuthus]|uniref:ATP synthase subunit b n=1 Tax=Papilio xuthus TaxID=66420 RepID=I4DNJ3_PAPXU|nr:ATP synthase subunit b, mitochondrial [Papilio xuthus]KPI97660.1 ATP synthase subunit b, mitochondrial [Papilio xuthus]BAM19483.1 ATP synthase [Papilio xuthus]
MLSRIALRSAAARQSATTALVARGSASDVAGVRDEKNFPRPVRGEPGKVRLGFVPEEWFQFFHSKTGVTGPYTFGVGLATYLFSKEIYVMEHEYYTGLSIFLMVYYATTRFGPKIAAWLDKEVDAVENSWNEGRVQSIKDLEQAIEDEKTAQWRAQGQELLIQAKKENVLLQLEAAYRERMMNAYTEVKRRLDYQLEKSNVERRLAQKAMVDWVVTNVTKAITPDQEKQALDRCIADLSALAAKH